MSDESMMAHDKAAGLLAGGAVLNALVMGLCSLLLIGVAYLVYEISDQMPGIHPAIPFVLAGLGVLNFAAVGAQGVVARWALGLRGQPDTAKAKRAFWLHIALLTGESLLVFLAFTLVGCPVVPILFVPGLIMALMARKRLEQPVNAS